MSSLIHAQRPVTARTSEDSEIDALRKELPSAPTHDVHVRNPEADFIEPMVSGLFKAQQARHMAPQQYRFYSDAVDEMLKQGPLKRSSLVAATRIAARKDELPSLIGASRALHLSDPHSTAATWGLLKLSQGESVGAQEANQAVGEALAAPQPTTAQTANTAPAAQQAAATLQPAYEGATTVVVNKTKVKVSNKDLAALKKGDVEALRQSMGAGKLYVLLQSHGGITPGIVELLRELSSNKQDFTALAATAASRGDLASVKALLETKAVVINCRPHERETLMHLAASAGHRDLVFYLLAQGHDANATYESHGHSYNALRGAFGAAKVTPLAEAVSTGRTDIVKLLLPHTKLNKATLNMLQEQAGRSGTQELRDLLKGAKVTTNLFGR